MNRFIDNKDLRKSMEVSLICNIVVSQFQLLGIDPLELPGMAWSDNTSVASSCLHSVQLYTLVYSWPVQWHCTIVDYLVSWRCGGCW